MAETSKKLKLKEFLENRKKVLEDKSIGKSQTVDCPDCKAVLFKTGQTIIKCCTCYGEYRNKEIPLNKTEEGRLKPKFPKNFGVDNIEMLLEAFKNRG